MRSIAESDLGTPKSPSTETVTLTIDGREVAVPAGTSVLRAASELGIQIPKLCATELLDAFGSCRLCLVQIEGMKGFPASCTTPVAQGMKVTTQNAKIADIRRGVMELYISDHPLDCLTCPANGHCELQDMAGAVGLREVRSEEHTSELQSPCNLVCRLLLEKKKKNQIKHTNPTKHNNQNHDKYQ